MLVLRVSTHALAIVLRLHDSQPQTRYTDSESRPHAVPVVRASSDESQVLLRTDHRTRVAGQRDDGKDAEDGVDGASFEPELAQVRSREQSVRGLEELLRRVMLAMSRLGASLIRR